MSIMNITDLFRVPPGAVAQVSIIDTTTQVNNIQTTFVLEPPVPGIFSTLPTLPEWSFLAESPGGQKALFDLGAYPNMETLPPVIADMLEELQWEIKVDRPIADTLRDNGIDPSEIDSIIWRHVKLMRRPPFPDFIIPLLTSTLRSQPLP